MSLGVNSAKSCTTLMNLLKPTKTCFNGITWMSNKNHCAKMGLKEVILCQCLMQILRKLFRVYSDAFESDQCLNIGGTRFD